MQQDWIVLKFGGSSVGEASHWQTIADQTQIQLDNGLRPILVLSALKNVSNLLEALLHQALAGVHRAAVEHLRELHLGFAAQLNLDIGAQLIPWFEQLDDDCWSIFRTKQISPKLHARILAIGELLSTTIGCEYLKSRNFEAYWQDARQLLKSNVSNSGAILSPRSISNSDSISDSKSDSGPISNSGPPSNQVSTNDQWHHYTSATCDYQFNARLQSELSKKVSHKKSIIVTQGFIAADSEQNTVLLGREGSDTSAAYLGAIFKARQIEIWTDVTGVFSANPREIPQARQLPELSYQHARLMAKFGAKVLHSRALQPVAENQIPLSVRCTGNPEHPGTLINIGGDPKIRVKAVVYEPTISQVVLPGALSGNDTETLLEHLYALGFDSLLHQALNQKTHLILTYSNSDRAQPTEEQLRLHFNELTLNINSDVALITLVGENLEQDWLSKNIYQHEAVEAGSIIEIYPNDNCDSVSLLVKSENYLELSMQLHNRLID